jgi:hypothetical protein
MLLLIFYVFLENSAELHVNNAHIGIRHSLRIDILKKAVAVATYSSQLTAFTPLLNIIRHSADEYSTHPCVAQF